MVLNIYVIIEVLCEKNMQIYVLAFLNIFKIYFKWYV